MITYKPFWETLKKKSVSTYALINKHGVSSSTINRLRHDEPLSTMTINDLCMFLHCNVGDILCYIPDEEAEQDHSA